MIESSQRLSRQHYQHIPLSISPPMSFARVVLTSCAVPVHLIFTHTCCCTFILAVYSPVAAETAATEKQTFLVSPFLYSLFTPQFLFLSPLNTPLFCFRGLSFFPLFLPISLSTHKEDLLTKRQMQIDWLSRRGDRLPIGITQHRALIPHFRTKPTCYLNYLGQFSVGLREHEWAGHNSADTDLWQLKDAWLKTRIPT